VTVADDGVGFGDRFPVAREGHFGMEQMRELAEDMGGSLLVESLPGSGTRVHARIPLILAQSKQ
jgi:signal transduction histidine kinase